jgi:hypothetical protein
LDEHRTETQELWHRDFRAGSNEEAQSIMNNDPAVKQGIMHAELYPYKVAGLNARDWQVEYA